MRASQTTTEAFGKYVLVELLSAGSFTQVFKAKTLGAKGFEKNLTLTKIRATLMPVTFLEQLTLELQRAVKVSHSNVLPFYDFGCVKEEYFLTQEYCEGLTLAELLARLDAEGEKLSTAQAIYLVSEVLKGLQAIHTRFKAPMQLAHGNIQPQTVLLSREGEVKIIGLGYERLALQYAVSDRFDANYVLPPVQRQSGFTVKQDLEMCVLVLFELIAGFALLGKIPEELGERKITGAFLEKYVQGDLQGFFKQTLLQDEAKAMHTALDLSVSLQRMLYADHPQFSRQEIVNLMQRYFPENKAKVLVPHDLQSLLSAEDTMKELIRSSRDQVNLVHREGTEFSTLLADTVAISQQEVNAIRFSDTESIFVKADVSQAEFLPSALGQDAAKYGKQALADIDDNLAVEDDEADAALAADASENFFWLQFSFRDPKRKAWTIILSLTFFVLLSILGLVALQAQRNTTLTDEQMQSPTQYQLVVRSAPNEAEIWLNGKRSDSLTPATFFDLEKNKSYSIVIKKSGFEDFTTVLRNETGQDQVIEITLRE